PGVYIIQQGLNTAVGNTVTVTGTNVLFYSSGQLNCSGCDNKDGIAIAGGGGSQIALEGPTSESSGLYAHLLLFQDRNVPANVDFNPATGQTATIALTGAVYAHDALQVPLNTSGNPDKVIAGGGGGATNGGGGAITID